MNINLMRKLDFWAGVPLCFLCSILNGILWLTRGKKKERDKIEKVLFIKVSELGAIILAYPSLRRVIQEYPSTELFFVTFEKNRGVFKLLESIIPGKNIFIIREDSIWLFALDTLRLIGKLRQEKIDIVFDLEFFSRFTAILSYLIKSDKRIGFYHYTFEGLYRGDLLTHKIQYNPLNHLSKNYLSLIQVIKKDSKNTPELEESIDDKEIMFPRYVSRNEIKERIEKKLKDYDIDSNGRLFLLNPGEGVLSVREWPLENFILLSRWLLNDIDSHIVIIGTEGAAEKGKLLLRSVNNSKCLNLVGQTTLEELMELFNIADALISNDCGLAHLAMLTSIKKFIIFGPESPQVFGPPGNNSWIIYSSWPCSPCLSVLNHRNSVCSDNRCLKAIKPRDVCELIKKSLEVKPEIAKKL